MCAFALAAVLGSGVVFAAEPTEELSAPDAPEPIDDPAAAAAEADRDRAGLDRAALLAGGALDVCATVTAPLGLFIGGGTALSILFDALCLIPGALNADHASVFYGTRQGQTWQAAVGLFFAQLWRVTTRWLSIGLLVVVGATALAALGAIVTGGALGLWTFGLSLAALPIATLGVLVGGGLGYIVLRDLRLKVQELLFDWVYSGLTPRFPDAKTQTDAQAKARVAPPYPPLVRAWWAACLAAEARGERGIVERLPVVGRLLRARVDADALHVELAWLAARSDGHPDMPLWWTRAAVEGLWGSEGGLRAVAELGLLSGLGLLGAGAVTLLLPTTLLAPPVGLAMAGGMVGVGVVAAASGVLALGLSEVPSWLRPLVVPAVYLAEEAAHGPVAAAP